MRYFKKNIYKDYFASVLACLTLSFLYFFTRFYGLKSIPYFIDEFIYARWAQQGKFDPAMRFVSLSDGKQPLFIWLSSLTMNILSNPLAATRIVSVFSGFITGIGLFLLSKELFKSRLSAWLTAFLFIIYPFALFINKLGIYESLVGALLVWTLYIEVLLVRRLRLDLAMILGLFFGLNLLTKTSGMQTVYLLPTTLLLGSFTKKSWKVLSVRWIGLASVALFLSFLYASILYLSPLHYMIAEKNSLFIYHLNELVSTGAFVTWPFNLWKMMSWVSLFLTFPLVVAVIGSVTERSFWREKGILFLWFLVPFIWLGLFGRILSPRYIYPMTLTLLPLTAHTIVTIYKKVEKRNLFIGMFLFLISFALYTNYKILTDIKHAPLPKETLFEHIYGWSSGEGIREIVAYLAPIAANEQIFIASEGIYGSLPTTAMQIYFSNNPNVEIRGFEKPSNDVRRQLTEIAKVKPVFVIFSIQQDIPKWPMELVLEKRRGDGNYIMRLYKIINEKSL